MFDYGEYRPNSYAKYNLLASMPHDKSEIKRDAASLRGFIQITPIEGLSYKMSLNIDYNNKQIMTTPILLTVQVLSVVAA